MSPVAVLHDELRDSNHRGRDYYENLVAAIKGDQDSIRAGHERSRVQYLPVSDQIDVLIELARDPNIIGRCWSGWSPII